MKELNEYRIAGGFDERHYTLVTGNKKLINTLAQQTLGVYFTESIQEEIADELGFDLQQVHKQCDLLFRKNILRTYSYQCAICGSNMRHDDTIVALEVAHIKWKQHGGPREILNGLVPCTIYHKAFDKGLIGPDENIRVPVPGVANGGGIVERLFWDFNRKTIVLPQACKNYPYEMSVEWHRKEAFRG